MSLRACISTFGQPCQRRTDAKTQGERSQTFLVCGGEGQRRFTDGADACDGVDACEWLFDDPGGEAPSALSTYRGLAAS
jgi:hypothetical protein